MQDQTTHQAAGPLQLRFTGPASTPDWWIEDGAGFVVLTTPQTTTRTAARIGANARRAVAAWNACDGITTAELEAMAPGAFPRGVTVRSQACEDKRRAQADAMRASLAELLPALQALTDWACTHTGPRDANSPHVLLIAAREALGKHQARAVDNAPADCTPGARDKLPGWVALLRARVSQYGGAAPLDDFDPAELLAEIDARR